MPTNVDVPNLGESVTEAVLIRWIKKDGEFVGKDEPVAELETDKANADLPAPAAGVLRHVKAAGDTVLVGETIGRVDDAPAGAAASAKSASQPAAAAQGASKATAPAATASAPAATSAAAATKQLNGPAQRPAAAASYKPEDLRPSVRRLVEENKVNPSEVAGTGPGGRLTKEDVVNHVESRGPGATEDRGNGQPAAAAAPTAPPPVERGTVPTPQPLPPAAAGGLDFGPDGTKRVAMSKIRKRIAENLVLAQQTAAILTTFNEVDLSAIMALRAKYKERFQEVYGIGLGFMSFFARAAVLALREFPRVNAFLEGDDVVYHNYVHLGIAVSTDRGLTVPVLRHVEQMGFARIESEIKRLAGAARDGKLSIQELSGGTFTITNGGIFGSLLSTPILNPPQSGILGMHAIKDRPVAVGKAVEVRPMMYLALSYDHRLVDGRESVSFLVRLKEYLEDPARLMLEI
jgi:2-oxoglutarate dehydrogenase E2 component (dihydrolipoamide succinyltransferase)